MAENEIKKIPVCIFDKLKVYVHVAVMDTWIEILHEMIGDMKISQLFYAADVTLVAIGSDIDPIEGCRVINTGLPLHSYEFPTLELLYNELEPNTAVMYCHLKGVSQPGNLSHRYWRRELCDFCLLNWRERIAHLHDRWTSGPRLTGGGAGWGNEFVWAHKHYSGNFWWARSEYLQMLPRPSTFLNSYTSRYSAESWIGQHAIMNEIIDSSLMPKKE
jgi:hypothetical protein